MFQIATRYPAPLVGRLTPSGPYFVDAAGHVVIRKSVTAFTAPKRITTGQHAECEAYLRWAAAQGFNEVRVFSHVDWTGPPGKGVESGWAYDEAACDYLLTLAASLGLRVEVVAHTYAYELGAMVDHLRRVDALCLRHDNALLEVANEPWQNGGNELYTDLLRHYTPRTPGWASGLNPPPNGFPLSPALTYHSPRKDEWSRCFKDAYEFTTGSGPNAPFSPPFTGPVMLDEPPQVEQTIRDTSAAFAADDWRAYGAGAAFFAAGATMHSNPTLQQCIIPTDPAVLACIAAFIAGFAEVPVQRYSGYSGALTPPSSDPGSRRYQRHGEDGATYEICVRPYSFRRA